MSSKETKKDVKADKKTAMRANKKASLQLLTEFKLGGQTLKNRFVKVSTLSATRQQISALIPTHFFAHRVSIGSPWLL
jgi:hypothetical protein